MCWSLYRVWFTLMPSFRISSADGRPGVSVISCKSPRFPNAKGYLSIENKFSNHYWTDHVSCCTYPFSPPPTPPKKNSNILYSTVTPLFTSHPWGMEGGCLIGAGCFIGALLIERFVLRCSRCCCHHGFLKLPTIMILVAIDYQNEISSLISQHVSHLGNRKCKEHSSV